MSSDDTYPDHDPGNFSPDFFRRLAGIPDDVESVDSLVDLSEAEVIEETLEGDHAFVDGHLLEQATKFEGICGALVCLEQAGIDEVGQLRDKFFEAQAEERGDYSFNGGMDSVAGDFADESMEAVLDPEKQQRLLRLSHMAEVVTAIGTAYASTLFGAKATGVATATRYANQIAGEFEGPDADMLNKTFTTVAETLAPIPDEEQL